MDLETRKAKAELLKGREVRRMPTSSMECRSSDGTITFRGVASSVDSPYDMGYYTESIARGAFDKTLARGPDVQLLINHEGLPISRTTNGSLRLFATDVGLEFEGTASADDPDAARVAAKIDSGLMDQCSFAFRVVDQDWDHGVESSTRSIREVSLDRGDVSVVNYGANPKTPVTVRSILDSWDQLSEAELDEFRVRLGMKPGIEVAAPVTNLSLYQARAVALKLRQPSYSASR